MNRFAVLAIAASLVATTVGPADAQETAGAAAVTGAGSTFAFPVLSRWSSGFQRWQSGGDYAATGSGLDDPPTAPALDYEPIGSLAGVMRVREGAVDFGASDAPLTSDDLRKLGLIQFPIVIGGVAVVVNIDGVGPGQMKFTGETLANIYLGKIQNWSDPAIKLANPTLSLPDAKIAVIRRSDGSGTTFNFASYLSKVSPEWRDRVGADLILPWPVGVGAKGNDGVSQAVRQTKHAIGYVEFAQAVQANLSHAAISNLAGAFVQPDAASFQAAAAGAEWNKAGDFNILLANAPGEKAYPIAATVFALMRKSASPQRTPNALNFFQWSFDKGDRDAASLGYIPLPPALVAQIKSYWVKNFGRGS